MGNETLTYLAIVIAWGIFRIGQFNIFRADLDYLISSLKVLADWFSRRYTPLDSAKSWNNPARITFKVDISKINFSNLEHPDYFKSNDTSLLPYFNQKVFSFNNLIDTYSHFVFSDTTLFLEAKNYYEENSRLEQEDYRTMVRQQLIEHPTEEEKRRLGHYIRHTFYLNDTIHTSGIGSEEFSLNNIYSILKEDCKRIRPVHFFMTKDYLFVIDILLPFLFFMYIIF